MPRAVAVIGALCTCAVLPMSVGDPPSDGPAARLTAAVNLAVVARPADRFVPTATPTPTPSPTAAADSTDASAPDCLVTRCVALTFDDGPVADTQRLLSILSTAGVRATFFDVGEMAVDHPELVREEAAQGEVGDHSWSHPDLTHLTETDIESQVERTAQTLEAADGKRIHLFRPPYGAFDDKVRSVLAAQGDAAILWSVDTLDWLHRDPDSVYRRAVDGVRPGSIVLMHDIHSTTITAVPRIIAELARRGYTFVTVSEMFGGHLTPGVTYTGREDDWVAHNRPPGTDAGSGSGKATPTPTPTPSS